jgi:uncharacterized protein YbaR (Trm112 family)
VRADLPASLPLVCPACRTRSEEAIDLHTLAVEYVVKVDGAGDILEGALRCENASCARRYPILDGVPIVVADLARFLDGQLAAALETDLAPTTAALLALAGPDGAPYARLLEHLSTYIDAHWGDRAVPPPIPPSPDLPAGGFGAFAERIAARAADPVDLAVELGASVGRGLAELARGARLAVGIDLSFGALRRARRALSGRELAYARRRSGRHYTPAVVRAGDLANPDVGLVCADALDPPLVPGVFGRVVALNLLDAVAEPPALLSVADGLCCPGGEILLASPYTWQSAIVTEGSRLGATDPAAELRRRFVAGDGLGASYLIEDDTDVRWWLRADDRLAHVYRVHLLRARKHGVGPRLVK